MKVPRYVNFKTQLNIFLKSVHFIDKFKLSLYPQARNSTIQLTLVGMFFIWTYKAFASWRWRKNFITKCNIWKYMYREVIIEPRVFFQQMSNHQNMRHIRNWYTCWRGSSRIKVHILWEVHKILQNLHRKFVLCSDSQIFDVEILQNFVAFSEYMNFNRNIM